MSGIGQDLHNDPIELLLTWLLTLASLIHITAAASLQPDCTSNCIAVPYLQARERRMRRNERKSGTVHIP